MILGRCSCTHNVETLVICCLASVKVLMMLVNGSALYDWSVALKKKKEEEEEEKKTVT